MSKNNILLDYSASGFCLSFRISQSDKYFRELLSNQLITASQYLKDKLDNHIQISGLFNAYTEENVAKRVESVCDFKSLFPNKIYADSGGLQAYQQNKVFDEEMIRHIYRVQSKYADYAFSFDFLPFKIVNGTRLYLGHKISGEYGKKAGDSIKEQINYFEKIDSKTKIFPICQGVNKGVRAYTENMFSQLNPSEVSSLECLACGGLIWTEPFEILNRSIDIYQLDCIPNKTKLHYHILGVTGFQKILPILIGCRNGLLSGIKKLSFDSSKFMRSYMHGNIFPSLNEMKDGIPERKLARVRNSAVEDYYQQIWDFWKDIPDNVFNNVDDMIEHSYFNSKGLNETQLYKEYGVEAGLKSHVGIIAYVYFNTYKFLHVLESYLLGDVELDDFFGRYSKLELLEELETIDDVDVFKEWYESVRYFDNGRKISNQKVHYGIDPMKATSWLF